MQASNTTETMFAPVNTVLENLKQVTEDAIKEEVTEQVQQAGTTVPQNYVTKEEYNQLLSRIEDFNRRSSQRI